MFRFSWQYEILIIVVAGVQAGATSSGDRRGSCRASRCEVLCVGKIFWI